MPEKTQICPMGPLREGDQAIVDALSLLPTEDASVYRERHEAVVNDFVGNRETTPGLPKDHWSVATLETDDSGNPDSVESTLVTVSAKDINVILRGGNIPSDEIRTEEDKPKATDRAKIYDGETEQSIKLLAAERLRRAAEAIIRIQS